MFLCVRCTVRSSDFLLFVKNGFVVGVHCLKVTARHSNNVGSRYEYPHCLSAMHRVALDNRPTQSNLPNTHTVYIELHGSRQEGREVGREEGGRQGGRRKGGEGRERGRGGRGVG